MINSSCQVSGNIAQLNSVVESMKAVDALYKEKEKAIKVFLDQEFRVQESRLKSIGHPRVSM